MATRLGFVLAATTLTSMSAVASSQAPIRDNRPRFSAASIRACPPTEIRGNASLSPGRMTLTCQSLKGLINIAFVLFEGGVMHPENARDSVLEGLPDWASRESYTVTAVADGQPSQGLMQGPMLQALLEERFRLRVHRGAREVPVYALTVAPGGPKLQPFQEGSCVPDRLFVPEPDLAQGQRLCAFRTVGRGPNALVLGEGVTVRDLIFPLLAGMTDRPIIDRTGLTGRYVVQLEFAPPPNRPPDGGVADAQEPTAAELFTALREQLGLRLEPARGPGEALVVDHIERLVEN